MPSYQDNAEIIVVGAGVSGLACALLLVEQGKSVRVVEARSRPGGRIRSVFDETTGAFLADLGPTWIWPAVQPVIARWLDRLGLETFSQFETGGAILDNGPDLPPEVLSLSGQDGNRRISGGSQAIVDQLAARLPAGTLVTNSRVAAITNTTNGMQVQIGVDEASTTRLCERVVVAIPPRIALNAIAWKPVLPGPLVRALARTPTWMAPHAKAVAIYDNPFWRGRGLSGRIASRAGPIVEGHDHCGPDGMPAAVFGFVGWPYDVRARLAPNLESHVHAQLMRCFGADSPTPRSIHIEDWAADPLLSVPGDLSGPQSHPGIGPEILRQPHAGGRLWFAAAETAGRSPGLIEGAFDAAEQTVAAMDGL